MKLTVDVVVGIDREPTFKNYTNYVLNNLAMLVREGNDDVVRIITPSQELILTLDELTAIKNL